MAYSANGKTYTNHPLMDEIVSCCKIIFNGIVIKNDIKAAEYETEETLEMSEIYLEIKDGTAHFDSFPFTASMLSSFTRNGIRVYTDEAIQAILKNRYNMPESLREETLKYCEKYFVDQYIEKNNYYRSLAGLPPYVGTVYNIKRERSDSEYNIYIYKSDFPEDYDTSEIDFTKPIHMQKTKDISILQLSGVLDSIIEQYNGFNYSYLRYLGNKSISFYQSRKASKWKILYIPKVDELVEQRFKEIYNINRSIYLKRTYQEAYKLGSNYYDENLIMLLLSQTFAELVSEIPEWYIRRDIFDIRSVQYFLESYGVKFFDEIPLKYQIAIVKNLNKLIKYKSSAKNNADILDIFNLDGIYIYKYYIYKERINDSDNTDHDNYKLQFIKYKQGDSIDEYLNDNIYRYPYDDLTLQDKFWDGVYKEWKDDKRFKTKLHESVKDAHIYKDYTLEGTKYMSIDYEIDMKEYQYQSQYFLGYILDSNLDDRDIGIVIPSIDSNIKINISDIFIFLQLLTFSYDNIIDNIRRPEDVIHRDTPPSTIKDIYYEKLFRDDGDYDDYIKWNKTFYKAQPVKDFDTKQFDFTDIDYKILNPDDDLVFDYQDIQYPPYPSYRDDDYDKYDEEEPVDEDLGYDFDDIYMNGEEDTGEDDNIYNFNETLDDPDDDRGYDFNVDPYEDWDPPYYHKHWEVKTYIENQDPIATSLGYNSYPVYLEKKDWIEQVMPEILETGYNKVNSFNSDLTSDDLDELMEHIKTRNSEYSFRHGYLGYDYRSVYDESNNLLYYEITYEFDDSDIYTYEEYKEYINPSATEVEYDEWKENTINNYKRINPRGPLGIAGFRVMKKIDTVESIVENFDYNTLCYKDLYNRIIVSNTKDEAILKRYVFEKLFTRTFDYKFYQLSNGQNAEYISQILQERSYILYNYYKKIIEESNLETRKNNIRSIMNDIITTLEYYLTGDNIEYIYSNFSITSFSSLLYYIYLIIGFFKSYKVYFLDPVVTYNINDKLENGLASGSGLDQLAQRKINYWKEDKFFARDVLNTNHSIDIEDLGQKERYKEVLDTYGHFDPDPSDDMNYDGHYPEEMENYEDLNGGVPNGKLNIPYKMINGGKSYRKYLDMYDLDGAGPIEMLNYKNVDGGYVYDPYDIYGKDNWQSRFSFIIDAGRAGTNDFITKTARTRVIDRQIEADILISNKEGNIIKNGPNGSIYIEQSWASWIEFNEITAEAEEAFDLIDYAMDVVYHDLITITDEELLQEKIDQDIDKTLYNIRKVTKFVEEYNYNIIEMEEAVDKQVNEFKQDADKDFNPYNWDTFY